MQTLVVGDIHGCYFELQTLLDKAGLSDDDLIIGLGDIVDRGPETPQVLDFFQNTHKVRALMGNHERKHVRAARGEIKLAISQQISRQQLGVHYPDAVAWMELMPLFIELPEAVLVHGYLEPECRSKHKTLLCFAARWGEKKSCVSDTNIPGMSFMKERSPSLLATTITLIRTSRSFIGIRYLDWTRVA